LVQEPAITFSSKPDHQSHGNPSVDHIFPASVFIIASEKYFPSHGFGPAIAYTISKLSGARGIST